MTTLRISPPVFSSSLPFEVVAQIQIRPSITRLHCFASEALNMLALLSHPIVICSIMRCARSSFMFRSAGCGAGQALALVVASPCVVCCLLYSFIICKVGVFGRSSRFTSPFSFNVPRSFWLVLVFFSPHSISGSSRLPSCCHSYSLSFI